MSLADQVAQLLVVRASGHLYDHQIRYPAWEPPLATLHHWIQDLGVGGVILAGGSAAEVAERTRQLQAWAPRTLLIAADLEEGLGQRFAGGTWFPPPMALTGVQDRRQAQTYAWCLGEVTAREALALGVNWLLAPVVDVNNNPLNPVINVRAFGETPETVAYFTHAFIQGAHSHPVLTTAKHFPGHGDTSCDSHLELPVLDQTLERLGQVELPPFRQAMSAGVDAVMTGHLLVPELDPRYPATLSRPILTGLLRQELGFTGLIVTDALIMGAIAQYCGPEEAVVLALAAGADMVLMPKDPTRTIPAVLAAVQSGRLSREVIQSALGRVEQAKAKVGTPHPAKLADLGQSQVLVQEWLGLAARGEGLPRPKPGRNLVIADDLMGSEFLHPTAPAVALPAQADYVLQLADGHTRSVPGGGEPTLLQLFMRGNPFRGEPGLSTNAQDWLVYLLERQLLQGLIIYGSPYVLAACVPHLPPGLPYFFTWGQMPAAQAQAMEWWLGSARIPKL